MKDQFKEEPSKRLLNIKFILENKTWLDEPNRIDFRRQKNIYADAGELFKFFERAAKRTGKSSYSRKSSTRNFFCSGEFEEDIDFENDPVFTDPKLKEILKIAPDSWQRCTAKFYYSTSLKVHQQYLEYYMPQKYKDEVKKKPEIFGNISLEEYKKKMVPMNYKWVISPEKEADEKTLYYIAKAFIQRCEWELGTNIDYQAVVHSNTEHPHIHILINGVDQKGKPFRFDKGLIRGQIMRRAAMEICTNVFGCRSEADILQAKERALVSDRYTEFDSVIKQFSHEISNDERFGSYVYALQEDNSKLVKRLNHFVELGIAEKFEGKYLLEDGWEDTLRALGRYNTFLEARKFLSEKENTKLELYHGGLIQGRIKKIYTMNAESVWNNALIVENPVTRQAWYVPLFKPASMKFSGADVEIYQDPERKGKQNPTITVLKDRMLNYDFSDMEPVKETPEQKIQRLRDKINQSELAEKNRQNWDPDIGGFAFD